MSSVEYLREIVNERLTAAAEEIFGVFEKAIIEYEEEIDRQRKLLDIVWKPERLHMIELPQQHVCKDEEVLADQQLCIQERNSSLDQEDPEPPQIKEEQEELCISQEEEQLELKQETETFMLTPTDEESDHSEDQTLYFNADDTLSAAESVVNIQVINTSVSVPNSDHQLLFHNSHVAESQAHCAEPKQQSRHHKSTSRNVNNSNLLKIHCNTHTGKQSFKCDTCGKDFNYKSKLQRHMRVHAGEKPYSCKTCGKDFRLPGDLKVHVRTHTGEKPYLCKTCGNRFCDFSALKKHMRIHTGEKPYACKTCGKAFRQNSNLTVHMRTHTGEKPFPCKTCGKGYGRNRGLLLHMIRAHAGEKPYLCKICGERFFGVLEFKRHIGVHTDNSFSI
ncbi:uncharacterized protein LOC141769770 [Sebastes fasciatus]|uniref:uncharacterized protein LOC141769770 n=1 Tax=Sebastes fasciatus TaxID=394691 RepID=UPI003D9F0D3C